MYIYIYIHMYTALGASRSSASEGGGELFARAARELSSDSAPREVILLLLVL